MDRSAELSRAGSVDTRLGVVNPESGAIPRDRDVSSGQLLHGDRSMADRELKKMVLGSRRDPLTGVELDALLQGEPSPELILHLLTALKTGRLPPDRLLIKSIDNARGEANLLPIALALREGASPNLYVNVDGLGTTHIVGYTYYKLYPLVSSSLPGTAESSDTMIIVINAIMIMLKAMGTKTVLPIFDRKGGGIKTETELEENQSVGQWLDEQGYPTIHTIIETDFNKVDPSFMLKIGSLLDQPDLVDLNSVSMQELVRDHSTNILSTDPKFTGDTDLKTICTNRLLELAMKYLNLTAFEIFLDHGITPNYVFVNKLLLSMQKYHQARDGLSYAQIREMLEAAIIRGVQLDQEQYSLLQSIDQEISADLIKKYQKPYWQKTCKVADSQPSDELKLLAFSLNIDPTSSKDDICQSLSTLSKADPKALKDAAIRRQMTRISADLTSIEDFVVRPDLQKYLCRNRSLSEHNPYDYSDIDIAYYKDEGGAVWCFTSDQFDGLKENKTNPYTNERLPDKFMIDVTLQRNMVKRLGITTTDTKTYSEAIDDLSRKDVVSDRNTIQIVKSFLSIAEVNGVDLPDLEQLDQRKMTAILRSMDCDIDLRPLSLSHARATFYRVGYLMIRYRPEIAQAFFSNVREANRQ